MPLTWSYFCIAHLCRISRLYVSEWSDTNIQRMIADGKLAPKTLACDVAASSFECPICFMVRGIIDQYTYFSRVCGKLFIQ